MTTSQPDDFWAIHWPTSWPAVHRQRFADARIDPRTLSIAAQLYVPSKVQYFGGNRAVVSHPLGPNHENYTAAVDRLTRRGFTVFQRP